MNEQHYHTPATTMNNNGHPSLPAATSGMTTMNTAWSSTENHPPAIYNNYPPPQQPIQQQAQNNTSVVNENNDKPTHPEWGVMKEQDFHPLTLKHQRDLENLHQSGSLIADFYFWQANLGGYCMADMIQSEFC